MDGKYRQCNSILGALIADASALGTHWIYNQDKLAEVANANQGIVSFVDRKPDHYANDFSYDAHASREKGSNTQYGEALKVAIQALIAGNGAYDAICHRQYFADHYGPGGTYIGYIDHATRQTLVHIAQETQPTGTDDQQLPALASIPAIVALTPESVETAIQLTNNNELSLQAGRIAASLLSVVNDGKPLNEALLLAADKAEGPFNDLLHDALETEETDSKLYAHKTGMACNLVEAIPLIFHILKNSRSYHEAVETNNLAGGDNAGRAIMIGAVAGSYYSGAGNKDIPPQWIAKYRHADEIFKACRALGL